MEKKERGSVTLVVLTTVIFVLILLSAGLMFVSTKRKAQLQESQILQNVYGGNVEAIYQERVKKESSTYISSGLLVRYDGINNTGDGHSDDTKTWKNLVGDSTFDGKINGATFQDNCLSLDGQNDWVEIGDLNGEKTYTLDMTVMLLDDGHSSVNNIFYNANDSGISFFENSNYLYFKAFTNDSSNSSKIVHTKNSIEPNKIYNFTGTYDGSHTKLYVNGVLDDEANIEGQLKEPENDKTFVLGTNPSDEKTISSTSSTPQHKKINIYSCRLYNRAISDEEVKHNYEIDQSRYNIE